MISYQCQGSTRERFSGRPGPTAPGGLGLEGLGCKGDHPPQAPPIIASQAATRHFYGGDGRWYNQQGGLESRYSDFVPYDYDERTLLTRIVQAFNYARSSIFQTGSGTSFLTTTTTNNNNNGNNGNNFPSSSSATNSSRTLCPSLQDSIEMISSSPSPTLHGSSSSRSSASYHGSYRSPRAFVKPPPAAALSRTSAPTNTTSTPQKRPLSQSWPSPLRTATKDSGTQYTPIPTPSTASVAQHHPTSQSPKSRTPPPEPSLCPQTSSEEVPPPIASKQPNLIAASAPQPPNARSSPSSTATSDSSSSSSSSSSSASSPKRIRGAAAPLKTLPADYSRCPTNDLVTLISSMLLDLIAHNDSIPLGSNRLTRFHSRAPPGISVRDYLQRLTTHATLAPPILLSMVYYIDRLCALYPAFTISSLTVHRFLITAATVASKGLSDSFWTNATYAKVGGVSLKELALLELEFLWRVEWRIVPRPEDLGDYYRSLVERTEGFGLEGEDSSLKDKGKGKGKAKAKVRKSGEGRERSGSQGSGKSDGEGSADDEGKGKARAMAQDGDMDIVE